MKTISMERKMTTGFGESPVLAASSVAFVGRCGSAARPLPVWLPAPRNEPISVSGGVRSKHGACHAWLSAGRNSVAENIMTTLLVFAAIIGIGYGFSQMVNLVQNWPAVNAWVAQLL